MDMTRKNIFKEKNFLVFKILITNYGYQTL